MTYIKIPTIKELIIEINLYDYEENKE